MPKLRKPVDALAFSPVDSTTTLDRSSLDDLQANILKGHGRDHTFHVFFKVTDADSARIWLKSLPITSARLQLDETDAYKQGKADGQNRVCLLALSGSGLRAFGRAIDNDAFGSGMASRKSLLDPDPAAWDIREPHGVVVVAHATAAGAERGLLEVMRDAPGIEIIAIERGIAHKDAHGNGIEHFGYVDGRSQPLFLADEVERERLNGGIDQWDPSATLDMLLVADPLSNQKTAFGSFFVFRKLEQDVDGFKTREEALALQLGLLGEDAERAGALVVGRFEDGTPLMVSDNPLDLKRVDNNFNYARDPVGSRCPLHAHVRVTNPRTQPAHGLKFLMARRGITYGERSLTPKGEFSDRPAGGVGLLFQAYMSSIENQFEETQVRMANHAMDPVIGQGIPASACQRWTSALTATTCLRFADFVHMRGGEYFYAPSLSGIQRL